MIFNPKATHVFFTKFLDAMSSNFVSIFSKVYIGLLALGVFDYAVGYDYFQALTATSNPTIALFLRIMIYIASCLFVFSILPKLSLSALLICFCAYEAYWGAELVVYTTNIAALVLAAILILIIKEDFPKIKPNKNVKAFSIFLVLALGVVYLNSALSKILIQHNSWLSGETLRAYIYEGNLFYPSSVKLFFLNSPALLSAISILTILWEACFFTAAFSSRKVKLFFLITGLAFHSAIYYILGPNFFYFFFPCYLGFIPLLNAGDSIA